MHSARLPLPSGPPACRRVAVQWKASMSASNLTSRGQPHGDRLAARATGLATAAAAGDAPQVLADKTVAVVGGGPGGVLCAAHLARLGASVTVYEKYSAEAAAKVPGWNIALGRGAAKAIAAAGLNADFPPHLRSIASSQHFAGNSARQLAHERGDVFVCTSTRAVITAHLAAETVRVHGDRVQFREGVSLVGGAVNRGEIELEEAGGVRQRRTVDLVVGADGVHSRTRKLLCDQDTSLVVREHACDVKTLTVAVTPLGNPSTYRDLPTPGGHSYDVFSNSTADPVSGTVTSFFFPAPEAAATDPDLCFLIVNSRRGGEDVTVGITATSAWWATEREDADLRAAMLRCFPHFPTAWHEDCVREAMDAPAAAPRMSRFVTCNKLGSGRAVLVGDAAHAMSANIGMGCNTALLDCQALAAAAVATGGDADALADRFTTAHLPDVRAISHISRGMYDATFGKKKGHRLRALAGMPMLLWFTSAFVVPKLPGVLQPLMRPRFGNNDMYGAEVPFRQLEADARMLTARLAALAAAVLVGIGAVAWKLVALI